ncbi:ATP-grasp domain-containing protein [Chitiniphilus shinanonensis]|uniref:ATP-grasp domain-containing protein n=1 Tax=Chitiniphilus shinanonensis TaxID=553088 RepID=A0ABQ6BUX1_9NEIS|nr:ATP-grasp domain-containing protein [Chitiniphilus shinanonensis]GLS05146.1 ATP-grasp domain-containing protein [Chitiniphilus shinanonensis]
MIPLQDQYVIVVDPFSSGTLYAPRFVSLGYPCVAVRSSPHISARFARGFQPAGFLDGRLFDIDEALAQFGAARAVAVVAGCEMAVAAADALAERLGLPGNPAASTALRRDKYPMQQALAAAGLRHIPSLFIHNPERIDQATADLEEIAYVVKPVNSASTDGVRFAHGREGARQALRDSAWGQVNDLGEVNRGFVVQPFVEGPEYVVDLVAHAGGYTVASVCVYDKVECNGARFVYAGLEALDPHDARYAPLLDYAREAAAALQLTVGPLHMELIWSDDGPVMIEAGARMHGGVAPALFGDCYSPNLLELAVDAYLGRPIDKLEAQRRQYGRIVFLIGRREGIYPGPSPVYEANLRQLPSYRGHRIFISQGERMVPTVDLATCPGIVWLASPIPEQLDIDDKSCRTLAAV